MRLALAIVISLGVAVGAPPVAAAAGPTSAKDAPDKEAKKRAAAKFAEGEQLFKQHQYPAAADAFEQAYAFAPHPSALLNAIDARARAGDLARAANLCADYLRGAPDDKHAEEARGKLADLRPKLGLLRVSGAASLRVDGRAIKADEVWVDPGDHVIEGVVSGTTIRRKLTLVAGATERVLLDAPEEPKADAGAIAAPRQETRADTKGGLSPTIVYVGAGVTAVLAGVTIWSGLDTNAARRDYDAAPTQSALDDGHAKQSRTNLLLGATAIVGVGTAAIAIFATRWGEKAETSVAVAPGALVVRGRF